MRRGIEHDLGNGVIRIDEQRQLQQRQAVDVVKVHRQVLAAVPARPAFLRQDRGCKKMAHGLVKREASHGGMQSVRRLKSRNAHSGRTRNRRVKI